MLLVLARHAGRWLRADMVCTGRCLCVLGNALPSWNREPPEDRAPCKPTAPPLLTGCLQALQLQLWGRVPWPLARQRRGCQVPQPLALLWWG